MRLRPLHTLALIALALALLTGCGGGGDDQEASSSTDVNQLLQETFSGSKDIKSGKLDVALTANAGGQDVAVKVTGPFESQGAGRLPKLAINFSFEGGGQNISAGVTSTGDKGFVNYGGTDYAVPGPVFEQFKAGFEQSAKQATDKNNGQSLATLGLDPQKWLTNAKNEGDAKVGDTDTIKITGDVDVPKLLDDLSTALQKLRSLGGAQAAQLPGQLSAQDKQQVEKAVKKLNVEIYTGKDDKILRRMVVAATLDLPDQSGSGTQPADVKLDLQLLDLNESQDISAPSNTKPFSELTNKLGGLGLGGLGGSLGGSSSGSGSSSGADQKTLEKYSQCIQDANGDNSKIRKCADLLTP